MRFATGNLRLAGERDPTRTRRPTALIAISHVRRSADEIAEALRLFRPPIISRIADGTVVIDLRTVAPEEEPEILAALLSLSK